MQSDGFFSWVGETLGNIIRAIVEFLASIFANLFGAMGGFIDGLTGSLGISPSVFSLVILVIGLLLLINGVRAMLRGGIIGGLIWLVLGLLVLSWLIP
ncbi:hypothetical protein [Kushneria marisflavi]|uniref:Uncharacterized protein n=1 Tax=Kushneria marisflavi TaxID=157779 RepID=A0A240UKD7_9GAMM|nr:hypothetical protein [Kushneria marisflavi]ART61967.1 hypothetical protein B9H00_01845 [Kushneria marisflavi]RKD87019.1 hypothetical protein C8D96_0474 [Kushneria marisflavi]